MRAWTGAFAASLALHAGVAAALWSMQSRSGPTHPACDQAPEGAPATELEVRIAAWEPVTDGPTDAVALAEQLPAQSFVSVRDDAPPSDEFAEPVSDASTADAEAGLLPPNHAAARARERYRRLLADGARAAQGLMAALARSGERHGIDSGDSGSGARAAPRGTPSGPTRGPQLAPGNRPPEYPEELRRARLEGTSWIHAVIEADGSVSSAHIARSAGDGRLDASALAAVERWRFEPALERGEAVRSEADLPVVFCIKPAGRD